MAEILRDSSFVHGHVCFNQELCALQSRDCTIYTHKKMQMHSFIIQNSECQMWVHSDTSVYVPMIHTTWSHSREASRIMKTTSWNLIWPFKRQHISKNQILNHVEVWFGSDLSVFWTWQHSTTVSLKNRKVNIMVIIQYHGNTTVLFCVWKVIFRRLFPKVIFW